MPEQIEGRKSCGLIVAGPTASGKSALAMILAKRLGGVVINADSMQVYRELRIVTARPSLEDEAAVEHRLYGVRPATEPGSAAWWRETALQELERARAREVVPILCGGTGLYFALLVDGIANVPVVGAAAREEARTLLASHGVGWLHARLMEVDPITGLRLRASDSQRVARAWEVWRGTGRGLSAWQADGQARSEWAFAGVLLDPDRAELKAAIARRFAGMIAAGAIEEVRGLLELNLDPTLPAMRAHGVPEISRYLRGEWPLSEAVRCAEAATGRYTKRQATWFRHHAFAKPGWMHKINARFTGEAQLSERILGGFFNFLK